MTYNYGRQANGQYDDGDEKRTDGYKRRIEEKETNGKEMFSSTGIFIAPITNSLDLIFVRCSSAEICINPIESAQEKLK